MPENEQEPKQQTQPKKGKPVTIPVPSRGEFFDALERVVNPKPKAKRSTRRRRRSKE